MPISKSAKKSLRSSRAKQVQNQKIRLGVEIALKTATPSTFSSVVSKIDKAAKGNVINRAKASRLISRLAKRLKMTKPTARATAGVKLTPSKTKVSRTKPPTKKTLGKKTVKTKSKAKV